MGRYIAQYGHMLTCVKTLYLRLQYIYNNYVFLLNIHKQIKLFYVIFISKYLYFVEGDVYNGDSAGI